MGDSHPATLVLQEIENLSQKYGYLLYFMLEMAIHWFFTTIQCLAHWSR